MRLVPQQKQRSDYRFRICLCCFDKIREETRIEDRVVVDKKNVFGAVFESGANTRVRPFGKEQISVALDQLNFGKLGTDRFGR